MADDQIHREPSPEVAENLLLRLDVEWIREFGGAVPRDPFHAFTLLTILLSTRKDLRKELSYHGFIQMTMPQIMAKVEGKQLGAISIEMRQQTIQEHHHDIPQQAFSVRAWEDLGNNYYASWFTQIVTSRMKQHLNLNEEHLADIVEAAPAIEMLKERTQYKTKTRLDALPDFYSTLVANLESWTPATCQALAATLP